MVDFDFNNKRNIDVLMKAMIEDIYAEITNETTLLDDVHREDKKMCTK